jgi:hypothetical protein
VKVGPEDGGEIQVEEGLTAGERLLLQEPTQ